MGDVLLALCIPLTLCASGLYAVCDSWWRRRRGVVPRHLYPGVCSYVYAYEHPRAHAGARLAEREMLTAAEDIVDEAYARLAWLYDGTCTGPGAATGAKTGTGPGLATGTGPGAGAGTRTGAEAGRVGADSTADPDPSLPAPARTVTRPPER
ncbi:hypothetical protein [Streptomyces tirandamycinicus]|uniref:Uncharacterized protein n=1 Tax=Streptomyces tirandamycinicus TaxID=2174846 RepID=A0A2S1SVA5_9ACTN|nr:hypothetical protein [Streptomyces tirandamycinicus]AWI30330.1 hypothetical protein DDW44_17280 [Streptomyces tirandamycinicus]